jgi:hypothetical protein
MEPAFAGLTKHCHFDPQCQLDSGAEPASRVERPRIMLAY